MCERHPDGPTGHLGEPPHPELVERAMAPRLGVAPLGGRRAVLCRWPWPRGSPCARATGPRPGCPAARVAGGAAVLRLLRRRCTPSRRGRRWCPARRPGRTRRPPDTRAGAARCRASICSTIGTSCPGRCPTFVDVTPTMTRAVDVGRELHVEAGRKPPSAIFMTRAVGIGRRDPRVALLACRPRFLAASTSGSCGQRLLRTRACRSRAARSAPPPRAAGCRRRPAARVRSTCSPRLRQALLQPLAPAKRRRPGARPHPHAVLRHPRQVDQPGDASSAATLRQQSRPAPPRAPRGSRSACGSSPTRRRASTDTRRAPRTAARARGHCPRRRASRTATAPSESSDRSPGARRAPPAPRSSRRRRADRARPQSATRGGPRGRAAAAPRDRSASARSDSGSPSPAAADPRVARFGPPRAVQRDQETAHQACATQGTKEIRAQGGERLRNA